jgi:two-component system cell cycle response regulator
MRIVLVDASRIVLKIITGLLEARGHVVHPFTEGPEALRYIKTNLDVAALITSAELPSMSGLEMCWETRLLSTCRRPIYIILMSSNYDRHTLTEALDSGADDFIGKPPVAEELYARLRAAERLASMQHELFNLATTDPLTGVMNRRAFFDVSQTICAADHGSGPVSAIMFDIDHFKRVNDVHGHGTGDDVIRAVAQAAKAGSAMVGRLGGEEFAILLEGRSISDAAVIAEHLRLTIEGLQFATGDQSLKVTCSFGVSNWRPGESVDELLRRADVALYEAKKNGRNRVVAAEAESSMTPDGYRSSVVRSSGR